MKHRRDTHLNMSNERKVEYRLEHWRINGRDYSYGVYDWCLYPSVPAALSAHLRSPWRESKVRVIARMTTTTEAVIAGCQ